MLSDLRFALRSLLKQRGYALMAAGTLALGIGACTSVFSVFEGVLLAPLPYQQADRIVSLQTKWTGTGRAIPRTSGGDLQDLMRRTDLFEAVSPYYGGEVGVQMQGKAEFAIAHLTGSSFFRVFNVQPVAGRLLQAGDDERAGVVSEGFARRVFGGPVAAVGKTVRLEGVSYEIVGVAPAHMAFPDKTELWLCAPTKLSNINRTAYNYRAVARLRDGVALPTAAAALDTLGAQLETAHPRDNRNKRFAAVPLRELLAGPVKSTLWWLFASAGLLLILACANVSNLMLARASVRARELAVRVALGASRWQLLRQTFAESILLAAGGGVLGALLAFNLTGALLALAPTGILRLSEVHVNPVVLGFSMLISLAASLAAGLSPAWQSGRVDVNESLKQGLGRGSIGGTQRLRQALAVAQVATAVVLAVGAGLLGRSLAALGEVQLGFQPERLLVMYAHAPAGTEAEYIEVTRLIPRILPDLAAIPGVRAAAAVMGLPAGRFGSNGSFEVEGRLLRDSGATMPEAGFRLASAGYFHTMGVPLLQGREFAPSDIYESEPVAVISRTLAQRVFPGEDPIGRRLRCGLDRPDWMRVVGVVGDVRPNPATPAGPELYMPLAQHPYMANEVQVVLRTSAGAEALVPAVRQTVRGHNTEIAMSFTSMDRLLGDSTAAPRFRGWLAGSFAGLALLLAMAGVYGVISYLVGRRRAEVGLRLALGATPAGIATLIARSAARLLSAGLAAGLAVAVGAGALLRSFLFEVKSVDVATYAAVAALVALSVALATALPAWRAARISPMETLRLE